ncbi:centromere protein X isoform X1 [Dasypus novemcinctus]|uniref:centromere protein X isoform X1 n=1 Tax=Dasypus novemcinctus TaxID=9361 RepID=UPI00062AC121|nr:centromere protein X isoform X1 [Dasypus novemcinctus]
MEGAGAGFRKELVSKLLHLHFREDKTKVSGDALQLMAEMLTVFATEAAVRAARQAQAEALTRVDVDQLEKVLPQLFVGPSPAGTAPTPEGAKPQSRPGFPSFLRSAVLTPGNQGTRPMGWGRAPLSVHPGQVPGGAGPTQSR